MVNLGLKLWKSSKFLVFLREFYRAYWVLDLALISGKIRHISFKLRRPLLAASFLISNWQTVSGAICIFAANGRLGACKGTEKLGIEGICRKESWATSSPSFKFLFTPPRPKFWTLKSCGFTLVSKIELEVARCLSISLSFLALMGLENFCLMFILKSSSSKSSTFFAAKGKNMVKISVKMYLCLLCLLLLSFWWSHCLLCLLLKRDRRFGTGLGCWGDWGFECGWNLLG